MIFITRLFGLLASCLLLCSPAFAGETVKLQASDKPAPAISFTDENGRTLAPDFPKYKLSAVHFWATWCVPCIAELPQVDAAAKTYGIKGLHIVALSLDGSRSMAKVRQFFADHHIATLAPYFDANNASFTASGLSGLPDTLFIDASGKEIARAEGPLNWNSPEVKGFIEGHLR